MATSTTTATELTQEQVQKIIIEPLQDQSVFLAAGPRMFDTNGSQVRIPKTHGVDHEDLEWVGENQLIPEADIDFEDIILLPSTMESVKVIHRYSNEVARQSIVALEAHIRDKIVKAVVDKLDYNFLSATGDGVTTPKGLFSYEGTQNVAVGGELTLDTVLDAWGLALDANVNMGALRFFLSSRDLKELRKIKDGDGRYMLQPDATAGAVGTVLGIPVTMTNRMPEGSAFLADFSQIAVARDMAPTVKILTERYADYDQQALRIVARFDAKPLNPEAIVTLTGITAAAGE